MIKEAYVSYEIAKLLKEKGFDEPLVNYYYTTKGERVSYLMSEEQYLCPTHQMACAWLREKHLIHVYAEHKAFFQERPKKLYYHWVPFVKTLPNCPINKSGFPKDTIYLNVFGDSYEDAVEAALKYTLEVLI